MRSCFLGAGKHVLCEKPLALNAKEARHVAAVAHANGRFLIEAMWSRFLPAYRALVSVLASGAIGEPLTVEADFGFHVPVQPDHRLFDLRLGGGALLSTSGSTRSNCVRSSSALRYATRRSA